jgi:Cu(I)/Ag(I) efflux system membrane protein CusA/SilA
VAYRGGFVKQYQVTVDPEQARCPVDPRQGIGAIRGQNNEVGGRLLEWSGAEYMVVGVARATFRPRANH